MKTYGVYYIILLDGENLHYKFKKIVDEEKNNISNKEYKTKKEAYQNIKTGYGNYISTVIYEKDTNLNYPHTYRLLNKEEIFDDFPICKIFKEE